MSQWTWALSAAVAAGLAGLALRRHLAALSYRYDDETNLPAPGRRWR